MTEHTTTPWEARGPSSLDRLSATHSWTGNKRWHPVYWAGADDTHEPIALVNRAEDADAIEAIVNAHADLVAACEPFARAAAHMTIFGGDAAQNGVWTSPDETVRLTVADFQAAAAALAKAGKDT